MQHNKIIIVVIQQKYFMTLKHGPNNNRNDIKPKINIKKRLVLAQPIILFKSLYWSSLIK